MSARASSRFATFELSRGWFQLVNFGELGTSLNLSILRSQEEALSLVERLEASTTSTCASCVVERGVAIAVDFWLSPATVAQAIEILEEFWGRGPTWNDVVAIEWSHFKRGRQYRYERSG